MTNNTSQQQEERRQGCTCTESSELCIACEAHQIAHYAALEERSVYEVMRAAERASEDHACRYGHDEYNVMMALGDRDDWAATETCTTCGGSGEHSGPLALAAHCPMCNGYGYTVVSLASEPEYMDGYSEALDEYENPPVGQTETVAMVPCTNCSRFYPMYEKDIPPLLDRLIDGDEPALRLFICPTCADIYREVEEQISGERNYVDSVLGDRDLEEIEDLEILF
jgi:hypothetical protein